MSNFPQSTDVFVDKTGSDFVASSDPNTAFNGIETTQGLIGALGYVQSWSTTLLTLLRNYKNGLEPEVDAGTLQVTLGQATLESSDGTLYTLRDNASAAPLTANNLDSGTLVATYYYVYGYAPATGTTCPLIYSTNALIPSGIGTAPFASLGWFKNEGVGSLAVTYAGAETATGQFAPIILGSYAVSGAYHYGTSYTAMFDAFVSAYVVLSSGSTSIQFWTGLLGSTTLRMQSHASFNDFNYTSEVCGMVRKGDEWMITASAGTIPDANINYIPFNPKA